ncbi:MAG TPA: CHASE3 domain-containing protein, partial [Verrucomicrobiae bacterium]|nr:CHASE3 domain-containing protein [Verrucomicrobiae bacterium]
MQATPLHRGSFVPGGNAGVAYWGVLLAVCVVAVGCYWTTARLVYTSQAANRTHELIEQITGAFSLVKDVQRGARGYVITGDEQFLLPYHAALGALQCDLARLNRMTWNDPARQERLQSLLPLITGALDEFRGMVALRRTRGFETSARKVQEAHGRQLMERIDRQITDWEELEKTGLARSATVVDATANGAKLAVSVAGLFGVFRFGWSGLMARRGRRKRQREEAAWRR